MAAAEAKEKSKDKDKGKAQDKAKPAKEKTKKAAAPAEAAVAPAPAAPAPAPPRPPADPRLKVLKKFQGRFLPKGVLRDRYQVVMTRWNSGDDHGGVTVEELKALLDDWRGTREKPPRMPKA